VLYFADEMQSDGLMIPLLGLRHIADTTPNSAEKLRQITLKVTDQCIRVLPRIKTSKLNNRSLAGRMD
jgi:hypothetical protein